MAGVILVSNMTNVTKSCVFANRFSVVVNQKRLNGPFWWYFLIGNQQDVCALQVSDHSESTRSTPAGSRYRCVSFHFSGANKSASLCISRVLWYPFQSLVTRIIRWRESCWGLSPSLDKRVCVGGWWRLSVRLDGLDKDIKGKQKVALLRGHRRGQTRLYSVWVGVSVQGCLSGCWLMIGGCVGLPAEIFVSYFFFFWGGRRGGTNLSYNYAWWCLLSLAFHSHVLKLIV